VVLPVAAAAVLAAVLAVCGGSAAEGPPDSEISRQAWQEVRFLGYGKAAKLFEKLHRGARLGGRPGAPPLTLTLRGRACRRRGASRR
jgi:hypothetical protein